VVAENELATVIAVQDVVNCTDILNAKFADRTSQIKPQGGYMSKLGSPLTTTLTNVNYLDTYLLPSLDWPFYRIINHFSHLALYWLPSFGSKGMDG